MIISRQDEEALVASLIKNKKIPRNLYKYKSISNDTINSLETCRLHFSSPSSFNDPFDCNPKLEENLSEEEFSKLTFHTFKQAEIPKSYKDQGINKEFIIQENNKALIKSIDNSGILCLSQKSDNLLMWSHYADYHKGIVLDFDLNLDLEFFSIPQEIIYTEIFKPVNFIKDPYMAVKEILTKKCLDWQYESEIRIIRPANRMVIKDEQIQRMISFKPQCLKRIIFGCKTSDEDIDRVRASCSTNLQHVAFHKYRMADSRFGLDLVSI